MRNRHGKIPAANLQESFYRKVSFRYLDGFYIKAQSANKSYGYCDEKRLDHPEDTNSNVTKVFASKQESSVS